MAELDPSIPPGHSDDFDPEPEAPIPPSDEACCGSGCEPCVWDLYQEELTAYRAKLAAWQARQQQTQA